MGASGTFVTSDKGKLNLMPISGSVPAWEQSLRQGDTKEVEYGALFDKNGNPIIGYGGNEHSTPVDSRVLKVENGTFTHYHPDKYFGGTLSMADLKVFAKSQLDEVRAVTSQGQLYSIKANKDVDRKGLMNWVKSKQKLAKKNFNKSYVSALKKATTPLKSGPHKGQVKLTDPKSGKVTYRAPMTPQQAARFARQYSVGMFERMYKKNLSKFGVTYTSTKGGKK